ncbi:dethiobiotin synthase [Pseudidiomarina tainanensis]|uniref:Dethiobiotin synthase n=1 Tax=Pseudidiomarina tainanensis TaxID=502365 RepID=A0ACD2HKK0_9GAMM|nr:dethiobiotin synthase [Pseudidiomarina tainanensis]RZQ56777.1 dethiobiotin synthase [Pseudidiomarina tainanensis]
METQIQPPLFITGTDTDAGKTTCAVALIHALRGSGWRVRPYKPVAAGAELVDGQLRNSDALKLMRACAIDVTHDSYLQVNPYCFAPPIAPHIAAAQVGGEPSVAGIVEKITMTPLEANELVVIEGAGGWLVPLNSNESLADVAEQLQTQVILVIGMKLGCLSHALLTAEAITRRGLNIVGWIANQPQPTTMACYEENLATLQRLLKAPCLGVVPFLPHADETALAQYLDVQSLPL